MYKMIKKTKYFLITCATEYAPKQRWVAEWGVIYICYQMEKGEETGFEHFQIFLVTKKSEDRTWVKQWIGTKKCHVKFCDYPAKARLYCLKDETRLDGPWEYGIWKPPKERKDQGHRSDLDALYNGIKEGKSDELLVEEMPSVYMRNFRAVDRVRSILDKKRSRCFRKVKVTVIIGEGGIGKTSLITKLHGYENIHILERPVTYQNIWFDGYDNERILLIDDFYGWVPWAFLLRILDGHPIRLDVRGAHKYAFFTHVYITSNRTPQSWYPSQGFPWELQRRINGGIIRLEK